MAVNNVNTKSMSAKLKEQAAKKGEIQQVNQTVQAPQKQGQTFAQFLQRDAVQGRFKEILDAKAPQFLTSVLSLYNNDKALKEVDPMSIVQSAMVAATLDLPIEKNFGYAWIIPYFDRHSNSKRAQFILGYKGYVQLALRSGQYQKINVIPVYEGELVTWNALTEDLVYEPAERVSDQVIGYAAYFRLTNGFTKTVYWTKDQVERHRVKFNKAKDKTALTGVWRDEYDSMAMKVVLTALLKKWGILSVELQRAIIEEEEPERQEINPEFMDNEYGFMDE
ncbi:MAG: recombinase RecT [Bacillus sp. (in: firmicutes)]